MELHEATNKVLTMCMKLTSDENVLILFDDNKRKIAESLLSEAKKITENVDSWEIKVGSVNGEEPKKDVADMMRNYDVIVIATTKSLSWTNARQDASESDARIASMPNIMEETLIRTMEADYDAIKDRTNKLIKFLDGKKELTITTKLGSDLKIEINPKLHGSKGGIYDEPGLWGNLPAGEAFFAPVGAHGTLVIDASFAGIGKLESPITLHIENNKVTKIEGGEEADSLKAMLNVHGPKAFVVAELGIGTNDKAAITGNTLEDEKVMGTAHLALGRNDLFGGSNNVGIHVDGVLTSPTIEVDGEILMEDGVFKLI